MLTAMTLMLLVVVTDLHAQCSVVGTGNVTGNVNFGSSNNWANPNRSTLSDDLYARVQLSAGETSKYLEVSDYGWVIPPGATITGIEANIEGHQEDFIADFADASIVLMKAGAIVGDDRAGTGYYDDKDYTNTYGNSTDLWGTTWTPADVMDPGFGILYSVTRLSGPSTFYMFVDNVELTVYYTGGGCILPVTYSAYSVALQSDQTAKIDWTTTAETNADLYRVERSLDGTNFETIGERRAQGVAAEGSTYTFTDPKPLTGTAYYRIRQLDNNGQSSFTDVKSITGHAAETLQVSAFPNPATDQLHLNGNLTGGQAELLDLSGRQVYVTTLVADANVLDVSAVETGLYILRVSTNDGTANQRIAVK